MCEMCNTLVIGRYATISETYSTAVVLRAADKGQLVCAPARRPMQDWIARAGAKKAAKLMTDVIHSFDHPESSKIS
jgi:hypothetical protein